MKKPAIKDFLFPLLIYSLSIFILYNFPLIKPKRKIIALQTVEEIAWPGDDHFYTYKPIYEHSIKNDFVESLGITFPIILLFILILIIPDNKKRKSIIVKSAMLFPVYLITSFLVNIIEFKNTPTYLGHEYEFHELKKTVKIIPPKKLK